MEQRLGEEIGRGGHGVVRILADEPGTVVKISNRNGSDCRKWSDEYAKLQGIYERLSVNPEYRSLQMVRVLFPKTYAEEGKSCFMSLPRIFPPHKSMGQVTVHPLFGADTSNSYTPGRGLFIGLAEIQQFLNEEQIRRTVIELGVMMGLLHFVARNDAFDIEVFMGREESPDSPVKLYIADFDLTESIESYDKDTIENRMYWSFEAMSYFPNNGDLYELFKEAYSEVALKSFGEPRGREIAEEMFELYN